MNRRFWLPLLLVVIAGCASPRAPAIEPARTDRVEVRQQATERLLELMRDRLELMPLVAQAKWNARLPIEDSAREAALLAAMRDGAERRGLPPAWVESFFRAQIEAGKALQRELFAQWTAAASGPFADAPDLGRDVRPRIDAVNAAILDTLREVAPYLDSAAVQRVVRRGDTRLRSATVSAEVARLALQPLLRWID